MMDGHALIWPHSLLPNIITNLNWMGKNHLQRLKGYEVSKPLFSISTHHHKVDYAYEHVVICISL